ncbi:MAG TPA: multiheme c-type cytochrome, partial [Candidatus Limnocylindrales bacterium]
MSLNQPPITDERQLPLPEPSGDGAGPATDPDERPPSGGLRFALPSIEWARVWRALRVGLRAGVVVVVVSVALGTAAFVAAGFYGQYGTVRNAPDTASWAALAPRFAGQTLCTSCHAPESAAQVASAHLAVSCESCHGPAAAHAIDATAASAALLIRPTSGICVTCHAATAGRPATFP